MPQPDCVSGEPLPATGTRPSMKSVAALGSGNGSQRSWVGASGVCAALSGERIALQRIGRGRESPTVGCDTATIADSHAAAP